MPSRYVRGSIAPSAAPLATRSSPTAWRNAAVAVLLLAAVVTAAPGQVNQLLPLWKIDNDTGLQASALDMEVVRAAVDQGVRLHVLPKNVAPNAGIVVLGTTMAVCPASPGGTGSCIDAVTLAALPGRRRSLFSRVDASVGRLMLERLAERNRRPALLDTGGSGPSLTVVPHGSAEADPLARPRAPGRVAVSLPAYSDAGHALVYVDCDCGAALCWSAWLFLLQREGSVWTILAAQGLARS